MKMNDTKNLFTEMTEEESAAVNGGCGYYYDSYYYKPHYYSYHKASYGCDYDYGYKKASYYDYDYKRYCY